MYAEDISGAQRLPNGNTLITYGTVGTFIEVTSTGSIVWRYVDPVHKTGIMAQGDAVPADPSHAGEYMNSVFRVYRYAPGYSAFTGRTLTPGNYIEKYSTAVQGQAGPVPAAFELEQNYPNPFNPTTTISFSLAVNAHVTLRVYDLLGRNVATLVDDDLAAGVRHQAVFDASRLASGVYVYRLASGGQALMRTLMLVK
jgi:hypothetical protein